jgi:hypothetical protein
MITVRPIPLRKLQLRLKPSLMSTCADPPAVMVNLHSWAQNEAGENYHVQVIAVRDCADRNGRRWDFGSVSRCRGSWRRSRRMLL